MFSKRKVFAALLSLCLWQAGEPLADTGGPGGYRLSEPVVHGNLAIYLVHGTSQDGPVPLTLQEALEKKVVEVREVGQVNELQIENKGDDAVFIQAGEIVKGGKQDRVLSVSLLLPPHSGALPISSYCVEQGRWQQRGNEDARKFSSASTALPSRRAKLEIAQAVAPRRDGAEPAAPAATGSRQQQIWDNVAKIQGKLADTLGAPVAAPQSQTSLQLALENGQLKKEQDDYVAALQAAGERDADIVGYVFAINGKVNSADIYPSNGLFRKMWPKLLRASVTEAIGERKEAEKRPAPPPAEVSKFIDAADSGRAIEADTPGDLARVVKKESGGAVVVETRPAGAGKSPVGWVYRNYLAR
jgi:hypothetical protein